MLRGLIFGTIAFGAAVVAERQLNAIEKDVARYNAIRAMSGDPPLARQLASMARTFIIDYGAARGVTAGNLFTDFGKDVVRYALMRTM